MNAEFKDYVYIARNSGCYNVDIYPATVGIRKFHGCVEFGAAWQPRWVTQSLYKNKEGGAPNISKDECKKLFGFYPRPGTAWFVDGKKRTEVDIAFSD